MGFNIKSTMLLSYVAFLVGHSCTKPEHLGGGCSKCRPSGEEYCRKTNPSVCTSSIVCCKNGKCICQESLTGCYGGFTHDAGRHCVQCCRRTCGDPDVSSSTTYTTTGLMAGNTVTYTCVEGFGDMVGDKERTCQEDYTWSGTAPVCNIDCGSPPDGYNLPNGSKTTYPSVHIVVCNTCDNSTLTCLENGTWGIQQPCTAGGNPIPENAQGCVSTYGPGKCGGSVSNGYKLTGVQGSCFCDDACCDFGDCCYDVSCPQIDYYYYY